MAPTRRDRALTLLEVLVTLAVVGILAGLAYPGFRIQLLRAHRIEAIEALLAAASAQERHFLANGRYATSLAEAGSGSADSLPIGRLSTGGRYRLDVDIDTETRYELRATPRPGSGQDADRHCALFTLRADGRRRATDSAGRDSTDDCWR